MLQKNAEKYHEKHAMMKKITLEEFRKNADGSDCEESVYRERCRVVRSLINDGFSNIHVRFLKPLIISSYSFEEIKELFNQHSASMSDKFDMVTKTDNDLETEPEDDPNAWYHDIDVDFAGLKVQNEDIVGWIYFEDEESISYPLLYSGDDYYLRRNYLKEEETAGSIYIDGNNSPDLDDAHTLIYGHNMRNLSMFGKLRYYKTEEDYLKTHRYFQLITESGIYRYEIFAYKDVSTLTGGIYTTWKYVDDDFKEFVEDTICQGSYVDADIDVDDETHIVTLSTCSYDSDVRFTVSGVRVDEHEWSP